MIQLKSSTGEFPNNSEEISSSPWNLKISLSFLRATILPDLKVNFIPSPESIDRNLVYPGKRENGPFEEIYAQEARQRKFGVSGGNLASSFVTPPPFFHGIYG